MKKVLLVGLLLGGCASNQTEVEKLLAREAAMERLKTPAVCPVGSTKVCQGPDRKTISRYHNIYCKCYSNRTVARAFRDWSRGL